MMPFVTIGNMLGQTGGNLTPKGFQNGTKKPNGLMTIVVKIVIRHFSEAYNPEHRDPVGTGTVFPEGPLFANVDGLE